MRAQRLEVQVRFRLEVERAASDVRARRKALQRGLHGHDADAERATYIERRATVEHHKAIVALAGYHEIAFLTILIKRETLDIKAPVRALGEMNKR